MRRPLYVKSFLYLFHKGKCIIQTSIMGMFYITVYMESLLNKLTKNYTIDKKVKNGEPQLLNKRGLKAEIHTPEHMKLILF